MSHRRLILFVFLAGCISWSAVARSCGADAAAERVQQELEAWWSDLYGDDPAASTAVLKMYKHADVAVPFLREKLPALELSADDCRKLLKDLGD